MLPGVKTLLVLIVLIRADEEGKFSNEVGKLYPVKEFGDRLQTVCRYVHI